MNHIGILIRTARRLRDIPQAQIALLIGRSQMYVSRVEHGLIALTDEERRKIEQFLDLAAIRRIRAQIIDGKSEERKSRVAHRC